MMDQNHRYGHWQEDEGYPLAAWIWGHRFRIGQHWMEYMLEFLNVLAGFDYEMGRGIHHGENGADAPEGYRVYTRLGLRRFVFYDDKEKTRHPEDDLARDRLEQTLASNGNIHIAEPSQNPLSLSKTLLRSLSAVEEQRSWYAKFLLPVHHNLLYWEALRKGATNRNRRNDVIVDKETDELDENIVFDSRNFFARGGEMYYLILSAGTENDPELREAIAGNLHRLLHNHNTAIGDLAEIVESTWADLGGRDDNDENSISRRFNLGWIPTTQNAYYRIVAEDLNTFLQAHLDPLETLDLLAHLINFHLTLYIYHHANLDENDEAGRPTLLIDMLGGREGSVVRRISAILYQEQEARIIQRAERFVHEQIQRLAGSDVYDIDHEIRRQFNMNRLGAKSKGKLDKAVDKLEEKRQEGRLTQPEFLDEYANVITDILMNDFRKNFLGVHRKLGKSIGFAAPKKGPNPRFVLGDNLLKALVMANLQPGNELIFDEFLARLYERYGLVIGPVEARVSGLYDRQHINAEYYDLNRHTLLEKMRYGGLAREYSDATAMVTA